MRLAVRSTVLGLVAVFAAGPLLAQVGAPATKKGLSITPYIGVNIPTEDLYTIGSGTSAQSTKVSVGLTFGGRLGIGLGNRVGIEGDVGYSPGSVDIQTGAGGTTNFNQDVRILSGSGRVTLYLIPRTSPFWLGVSGGVGAVRHTFKTGTAGSPTVKPGTDVGGVLGAGAGIRIGRLLAVSIGVEDYLYNASFDVDGTKTAEKKQHDIRITGGIRVPFLGF
jgi:outer membrane protein with beta-barrel domain